MAVIAFVFFCKDHGDYPQNSVPPKFERFWLFWRAGDVLAQNVSSWKRRRGLHDSGKMERICNELYMKVPVEQSMRKIAADRYAISLLIAVLVLFLSGVLGFTSSGVMTIKSLERNPAGEGEMSYDLWVNGLGEDDVLMRINVADQLYADVDALFETAYEEALSGMYEEGDSADSVRHSLTFKSSLCNGLVKASWESSDTSLIGYDGTVHNEDLSESGEAVNLIMTLTYEDEEVTNSFEVLVQPPVYTEEELRENELSEILKEEDNSSREHKYFVLPTEINGRKITFLQETDTVSPVQIAVMGGIAILAWLVLSSKKIEDKAKEREEQMERDYPNVILKMAILLRAGLTVRGSWERIVENYRRQKALDDSTKRYVYEEMQQAAVKILGGKSESEAYLEFGRRTHLQCYLKFSSLLEQNLKKGGRSLVTLLETESEKAWHDRKSTALKKGEEAGTKMILPMMMNMIVIMMVIMAPATITFS